MIENVINNLEKNQPAKIYLNGVNDDVTIEMEGDFKSLRKMLYLSMAQNSDLKEIIIKAVERYNEAEKHLHKMIERKAKLK